MDAKKIAQTITMVLGMISFICLIVCFFALGDLRDEQASSTLAWRVLSYAFWPIAIFHLVFLITAACIIIAASLPSPPPQSDEEEK